MSNCYDHEYKSNMLDSYYWDNKVEAKMGNEAFFEPDIFICPLSLLAPKTSNFCMIKL